METEIVAENEDIPKDLASVGSRLLSFIIDNFILIILMLLVFRIISADAETIDRISSLLGGLINFAYFLYFFSNGQTPGMMAMKIKLIGTDGTYPIGYSKGFLRYWGLQISGLVLCLGFLWILIDKKRQGWHDKIAGTYVVKA